MTSPNTRESIATNAAAWVLHHGFDSEDDRSHKSTMATEDEIDLAREVARRVLRHIDSLEPEDHVAVPVAELEELRAEMADHGPEYLGRIRGAAESLFARIPEPPDPAIEIVTNYLANAQGNNAEPKATDIVFYLRQAGLLQSAEPEPESESESEHSADWPNWDPDPDLVATVATAWHSCLAGGLNEKARAVLRAMHAHGIELPEADS